MPGGAQASAARRPSAASAHRRCAVRRAGATAARASAAAAPTRSSATSSSSSHDRSHETDYVVVGSGIGGLCCGALLAYYGSRVTVVESHYLAGGAAHGFEVRAPSGGGGVYKFDAGPSFHMGLDPREERSANPLKQVLDLLGEKVECERYSQWVLHPPEGGCFPVVADRDAYAAAIERAAGPAAAAQFRALEAAMAPLQRGAALFPAAALRSDPGVIFTAARFFGPELLALGLVANQLTGPFSAIVDRHVADPYLRALMDLECFVLSGMTARDTLAAEMAFMFAERGAGRGRIDYPLGGSEALVAALVRGLERHGGRLLLRAHVDEVLVEGGRAAGVALRPRGGGGGAGADDGDADERSSSGGSSGSSGSGSGSGGGGAGRREVIRARKGVVSNASVWDTAKLLPPGSVPDEWRARAAATPECGSFVHLHLGIDAAGLPADLDCHHLFVDSWADLEAPQNVRIASIPTVFDASLAPPGKAVGEPALGVVVVLVLVLMVLVVLCWWCLCMRSMPSVPAIQCLTANTPLLSLSLSSSPTRSPRLHRRQRALRAVGRPPARHPGVRGAQGAAQPLPLAGAREGHPRHQAARRGRARRHAADAQALPAAPQRHLRRGDLGAQRRVAGAAHAASGAERLRRQLHAGHRRAGGGEGRGGGAFSLCGIEGACLSCGARALRDLRAACTLPDVHPPPTTPPNTLPHHARAPHHHHHHQAASGMIAANALSPVWSHLRALDALKL